MPGSHDRAAGSAVAQVSELAAPGLAGLGPPIRKRLFRRFAVSFAALVAGALLTSGAIEIWFSYREHEEALGRIQYEKAAGAAAVIRGFVDSIEGQLGWTTHRLSQAQGEGSEQRRLDFIRLLRQVPAITEVSWLDPDGREQLLVSRLSIDTAGRLTDLSSTPQFLEARADGLYIGPVYFHKESEPYITMAVAAGRSAGVTVAEVNLKFIWDLVSGIDVGGEGRAYVLDRLGRLIAHTDIGLVLQNTDMSGLDHVRAIREGGEQAWVVARDLEGHEVLSAHAAIPSLGWLVFVDRPLGEALAPVLASLQRNAALVLVGVALAVLIGLALGRRLTGPIALLREGAARIGAGDLRHRIEVLSGDELEELAGTFNRMATQLGDLYVTLEQRVDERTAQLSEALDKVRSLADIAQTVNSSLDLEKVLSAILAHACKVPDAVGGAIYVYDDATGTFRLAAGQGMSPQLVEEIRRHSITPGRTIVGQCAERRAPVQIPDLAVERDNPLYKTLMQSGVRALLGIPLLFQGRAIGALIVRRMKTGEFSAETVDLLASFASQSALAVHNARLFQEVEQKGRQLEVASQHKSQFLANMSHELRTPLNAVLGYAELLQDGIYGPLPEKVGEVLERVQSNGRHLLGLINDVLDLSKIEAGQMVLTVEDYSVATIVHGVVAATESLAKAKGLALTSSIAEGLPLGRGDERRLTQVLVNVVGNAIKFTQVGSVHIGARSEDDRFVIEVTDTGPGIAPQDQDRIFAAFQQVSSLATKSATGTGLGLSITRKILEMHGGGIAVESTLGHGSTFRIDLPVRVQETKGVR
jgi:signal transduction histidine kinase